MMQSSVFRRNAQLHNETHLTRMMNWRLMHEEWTKGRSWVKKMSTNRLENETQI